MKKGFNSRRLKRNALLSSAADNLEAAPRHGLHLASKVQQLRCTKSKFAEDFKAIVREVRKEIEEMQTAIDRLKAKSG